MLELGDAKKPLVSWGGFTSWVAWRRCVIFFLSVWGPFACNHYLQIGMLPS